MLSQHPPGIASGGMPADFFNSPLDGLAEQVADRRRAGIAGERPPTVRRSLGLPCALSNVLAWSRPLTPSSFVGVHLGAVEFGSRKVGPRGVGAGKQRARQVAPLNPTFLKSAWPSLAF